MKHSRSFIWRCEACNTGAKHPMSHQRARRGSHYHDLMKHDGVEYAVIIRVIPNRHYKKPVEVVP